MRYILALITVFFVSTAHADILDGITIAPENNVPKYKRSDYPHWKGTCPDVRQLVLIEESFEPVTFETDRKCRVDIKKRWDLTVDQAEADAIRHYWDQHDCE